MKGYDLPADAKLGPMVSPYCGVKRAKFCPCRSVEPDPRLSKEWHPSNYPAYQVAKSSGITKPGMSKRPSPISGSCGSRCSFNTGCPVFNVEKSRRTRHSVVSFSRPDLAREWDQRRMPNYPVRYV